MTIAELRGKISSKGTNINERLEDLLTSDVFGSILYAEDWDTFSNWFSCATNWKGETITKVFSDLQSIEHASMEFWPSGGLLGREPDLVLKITDKIENVYGICVEAKYLSGKSNVSVEPEPGARQKEDTSEKFTYFPSGDQLADQWMQIQQKHIPSYGWDASVGERALLFVTAHTERPQDAFIETFKALQKKGRDDEKARKRLFWLGWFQLHEVLKNRWETGKGQTVKGTVLMMRHLFELLERKNLRAFRGYKWCFEEMNLHSDELQRLRPVFWKDRFFAFLKEASLERLERPVFWKEASHGKCDRR